MDYSNLIKPIVFNQKPKRIFFTIDPNGNREDFESWSDLVDFAIDTELYNHIKQIWNGMDMSTKLKSDERAFQDFFSWNLEEHASEVNWIVSEEV